MSKQIKKSEFQDEVLNSTGIVLVDFFASWCGPCKMLAPVLDKISEEKPEINVVKINIDEESDFAIENNIEVVPTVMIYKNGEKVDRFEGYRDEEEIIQIIKKN